MKCKWSRWSGRHSIGGALLAILAAWPVAGAAATGDADTADVGRQTTLKLIGTLVEQGVLTREKADELVSTAERLAAEKAAAEKKIERGDTRREPTGRVRVPLVPETVKSEIREQIKQEVLAQARNERWAEPNAVPEWLDRIMWEGDIRLRHQAESPAASNEPASSYLTVLSSGNTIRAADFASFRSAALTPTANTTDDRERQRVRARLGVLARVSAEFSAGVRLATGSATDRVSTNQTLGQNFNKNAFLLDRAYVKYDAADWVSVSAGRIANPWFSTDLVWDEDLNFEGLAATVGPRDSLLTFQPFLTVGAFPMRESDPPRRNSRWLYGAQGGFQWNMNSDIRLKTGLAYYQYHNLEGRREADNSSFNADYGRYEYEAGLRQKGNSLFLTNDPFDPSFATSTPVPLWGLASRFKEVNLTAALDLAHWDPIHITLVGDYVINTGWDRDEILARTRLSAANLADGSRVGRLVKLQVGKPQIRDARDWNVSVAWRYLGSDAVLDAFTDSDFGLGGTNTKGYQLAFNFGVDRNVSLGLRWMSADSIDSMIPDATIAGIRQPARYSVDLLQVDLTARF